MKRLRGRSKKAVAEGTVTWCVRLLPSVPRPVAGWYGSPIPESSRRRVLLNVQEARKTREAGGKTSFPAASTYLTTNEDNLEAVLKRMRPTHTHMRIQM